MTIFRGTFLDTPDNPFEGGELRCEDDGGLVVRDGTITARGGFADVRAAHPGDDVVDLRGGVVLPGLVDTHVHYPQVRAIGGLGLPLLDWLDQCALPEEARLADAAYAATVATEFVSSLVQAGTTTSLVFGSHFAAAVDLLFSEVSRVGLRVTSGLVVSDRILRPDLLSTPQRAYDEGRVLAERWHGTGRTRYAVTPRFSLSSTDDLLDSCAALAKDVPGSWASSHLNENLVEIAEVTRLFAGSVDYLDTYDRHGLVGARSVFAHNVHVQDRELSLLAAQGAGVAHCPTSNAALGSGLFPLRRHLESGVTVALGSDVGAGTGFSLLKEALQAYFHQQLLGPAGTPLRPAHLLHLATRAGALALGLGDEVGDLSVGRAFDALWLRPTSGGTADVVLRRAESAEQALARLIALGTVADTAGVWVAGERLLG